jgi:hypothetical protein
MTLIRQGFGEESMSFTRKIRTQETEKKARQVKGKVKSMLIIFFDIKGIVHREFALAGQPVNSAYYCDVLRRPCKNVRKLRPELWRQTNWLLHHNTPFHTSFFTMECFTRNNRTDVSTHLTFLFHRLKIKLKDRHFDTIEVIEVELQAVLNNFTEPDFQEVFKKLQRRGRGLSRR